jgi:hypothetical protein
MKRQLLTIKIVIKKMTIIINKEKRGLEATGRLNADCMR